MACELMTLLLVYLFHTENELLKLQRYLLKSIWYYVISKCYKKPLENIKLSSQAPGLDLLATTKIKKGNGNHIQRHKLVSLTVGWHNRNVSLSVRNSDCLLFPYLSVPANLKLIWVTPSLSYLNTVHKLHFYILYSQQLSNK